MSFLKVTDLKPLDSNEEEQLRKLMDAEAALKRLADVVMAPLNDRSAELQKDIDNFWVDVFKARDVEYDKLNSSNPVFEIQKRGDKYEILLRNYTV